MSVLAGRFTLVNRTKDTVTVGLIGNVTRDTLSKDNIEYLRGWYGTKDWGYRIIDDRERQSDDHYIGKCNFYIEFFKEATTDNTPIEHDHWFIIGVEKATGTPYILHSGMNERDAESFCESWGWSYDDGRKSYWLKMERMDHSETRQYAYDISKSLGMLGI